MRSTAVSILFANVSMIQYRNVLLNWNVMPDLPPLLGEVAKPLGFDGEVQFPVETSQALRASSPNRGAKKAS